NSHLDEKEVLTVAHMIDPMTAQLFTASRAGLKELLQRLQIDPDLVTASPVALVHFLKWKMPHVQDAFIVDLASDEWTCVCMENRKKIVNPKEISSIAKQIDLLQMKAGVNSQLADQMIAMRKELARVIYSFSATFGQKPLFFTGRVDAFAQLPEFLEEAIQD